MARSSRILLALAATLLLAVPSAFAQGGGASSTGSISGEVKDAQGGVLPGVTVTATSPAQIGALSAVTNEAGIYRFPAVPPGEYSLTYELAGFGPVKRDGVRITLGFNAQVNVTLAVASLNETLVVSGESPVIDTSATRLQTNYDSQNLASLPNARDMWSLLATTPSVTLNRVDVGGATMGTQTTYFAYGYSGQNRPLVEGINTTEGTAAAGFYLDYGSFDEVFIGAAANSAEMPNPGVLTQFVSKSGGNSPSVNFYFDFEDESVQSRNLAADQVTPSVGTVIRPDGNRLASYKNTNIGVGGPVLRDRIWGFGAFLDQRNSVAAPPAGSFLDGTPFDTKLRNYTGKLSYQMNQNNKFIGYLQHGTKQQPNRTDGSNRIATAVIHLTADSTVLQDSPSWVYKGEWNGTITPNMFVEVRGGQFGYNFGLDSNTQDTRYESLTTNQVIGGGRDWELRRRRNQYTGAISYFKDNFLGGSHNLKGGGEYLDETGQTLWNQAYAGNVIHFVNGDLRNGVASTTPASVRLQNNADSLNALATTSAFVTDTFTVNRLTLNVGARFDRYRVWLPEQSLAAGRFAAAQSFSERSSIVTFNHLVPRLGASYDLMGDGRTVLKANLGRFYFNTGVNLADALNPNTANQFSDFTWIDRNGDRVFQDGEQGVLEQRFGGSSNVSLSSDLSNAYTDEASVFVERSVMADLGVRAGFVWKKDQNGWQQVNSLRPFNAYNVATTVTDPGIDGVVGTGDDRPFAALNLDPSLLSASNQLVTNIDGYEGTYKTLEFSANKRFSNRWSALASFSYTWTDEFGNLYFNNRFATAVSNFSFFGSYPTNPNEKTENEFTNWNGKLSGSVDAGWGVNVTPVVKIQSGAPYGRFFTAALNYGNQILLAEPIGTRRQDTVAVFDIRAEKRLRLGSKARAAVFADVFNLMNSNTAVNINWRSGSSFEKATTVLGPRIAKFGVKFDW
jgi:Carboxypeptidase regulatory-like domain